MPRPLENSYHGGPAPPSSLHEDRTLSQFVMFLSERRQGDRFCRSQIRRDVKKKLLGCIPETNKVILNIYSNWKRKRKNFKPKGARSSWVTLVLLLLCLGSERAPPGPILVCTVLYGPLMCASCQSCTALGQRPEQELTRADGYSMSLKIVCNIWNSLVHTQTWEVVAAV